MKPGLQAENRKIPLKSIVPENQAFYQDFDDRASKKFTIVLKIFSSDSASKTDSRTLVFDRSVHIFNH